MQITEVCCAVIIKDGMLLAANRGSNVSQSGTWEFPGGKPREKEAPEVCVVRRLQEETGLLIRVLEAMPPYEVTRLDGRAFRMNPFLAEIVGGHVELTNHSRAEWFKPEQLLTLAWPETDLPVLEEVVRRRLVTGDMRRAE